MRLLFAPGGGGNGTAQTLVGIQGPAHIGLFPDEPLGRSSGLFPQLCFVELCGRLLSDDLRDDWKSQQDSRCIFGILVVR